MALPDGLCDQLLTERLTRSLAGIGADCADVAELNGTAGALCTYREVLGDPESGDLLTGSHQPQRFDQLISLVERGSPAGGLVWDFSRVSVTRVVASGSVTNTFRDMHDQTQQRPLVAAIGCANVRLPALSELRHRRIGVLPSTGKRECQ